TEPDPLAQYAGGSKRDRARTPGWSHLGTLRTARDRPLCCAPIAASGAEKARHASARCDPSGGVKTGKKAFPELEAPPPDLRDLTLWARIVDRERVQRPLPQSRPWDGARVASPESSYSG